MLHVGVCVPQVGFVSRKYLVICDGADSYHNGFDGLEMNWILNGGSSSVITSPGCLWSIHIVFNQALIKVVFLDPQNVLTTFWIISLGFYWKKVYVDLFSGGLALQFTFLVHYTTSQRDSQNPLLCRSCLAGNKIT